MRSKITLAFICFFLILIHSTGNAQTTATNPFLPEVIKIDPISRRPEKPIPFDKPFAIITTIEDIENVTGVLAYEVVYRKLKKGDPGFDPKKKNRKVRDIKMKEISDPVTKAKSKIADPIPGVGFRKDIKQKLLIIEFPSLPPGLHFDFAILRKMGGDNLKAIRKYMDAIADSLIWHHDVDRQSLEVEFYGLANSMDKTAYAGQAKAFLADIILFKTSCCDSTLAACAGNLSSLSCFYKNTKMDEDYDTLRRFNFSTPIPDSQAIAPINALLITEKFDNSGMTYLYTIHRSPNPALYLNGQLSFKDLPTDKEAEFLELDQRVANLDTGIASLKIVRTNLEKLILKRPAEQVEIVSFAGKIDQLLTKLRENRKIMSTVSASINGKISENSALRNTDWYLSTTEIKDLQTKSGYIFTPQVGLSLLVTRSNENKISYIPKLNWGININMRAIDKLITRRDIDSKTLWHYLSLYVGLTVGGFREKEYENLYNGTSLMVGPSFRINRVFYFSAGLSVYRQKDNNPIINKTRIATGGYTSLLLDLDFTNAISTIRSLLFK